MYNRYLLMCIVVKLNSADLLNYPNDVMANGCNFISHNVSSVDGYMLAVHHFYKTKTRPDNVVLFIHGITQTARSFFENEAGLKNSLGWMFIDKGYHVFLFNSRGTEFSRNHTYLDRNSANYWSYDWTEVALYDVSKTIDVALEIARVKQIKVVCYSLGCSELFVLLSEWNFYNKYIEEIHAIAPAVFLHVYPKEYSDPEHLRYLEAIASYVDLVGNMEANAAVQLGWNILCRDKPPKCVANFYKFLEYLAPQFYRQFEFYLKSGSTGSSLRIVTHFYQISVSKKFRKYDYGAFRNWLAYNQDQPPDYQTRNITAGLYVYNAYHDELLDSNYFKEFYTIFGNLKKHFVVTSDDFGHKSFIIDKRARQLIYPRVISLAGE